VFELGQQGASQQAESGPGVEDDDVVADADFDAGGIASITDGAAAGRWNGPADPPELDGRPAFDVDNINSIAVKNKIQKCGAPEYAPRTAASGGWNTGCYKL
jgi:hypothetical protein